MTHSNKAYNRTTTITCRRICEKYKATIKGYKNGQKRCNSCEIMMIYAGIWCPCCGLRMRSTPRSRGPSRKIVRISS